MKAWRFLSLVVGAVLLSLAVACASSGEPGATSVPEGPAGVGLAMSVGAPAYKDSRVSESIPSQTERLIVRNVDMTLVVAKPAEAVQTIAEMAEETGGFVVSSYISGEKEATLGAFISMRVPAAKLDETLTRLRGLALRVTREQINSQDVTEEYVDLGARLKNLEAAEAQLLKLMERAQKVEEVLMVQRELTNVQQQIESLKARIQYLERTSAMALASVSLVPEASEAPLAEPGWSALETVKEALRSLFRASQGLVDWAVWVAIFAPFWFPLVVVGWLARRRVGRWLKRVGLAALP
ncbi:MAG: DUF4349 domain-containing protein [Dehalococcoidia bacterium]|nr:DUF4349 domain-containing protein [Dehalococcoidia bacterium]